MMFLLHIAAFLGAAVLAGGFVGLHFAAKTNSAHIRNAAWLLLVVGILGLGCIMFYSFSYWQQGAFTTATPMRNMPMNNMPMNNMPMNNMPMNQMPAATPAATPHKTP